MQYSASTLLLRIRTNCDMKPEMMLDLITKRLAATDADEAARALRGGGLVAFPTETVYGLGADAVNAEAVARLYAAKGRPSFNPLIAHVADLDAARAIARFDSVALRLAEAFWPGPLTLVLPKAASCSVCDLATAGLDSVALRVPAHPVAQALLRAFGGPVVAPSANRSGHVSPTTAAHVATDLGGRIDVIVDGGAVTVGVESTIVGCLGDPVLLRPGGVPREAIERVLGGQLGAPATTDRADHHAPVAPGMLASHYAPRALVRLNAAEVKPGEALLAFGPDSLPGAETAVAVHNLSRRGDLTEAAAHLFGALRTLDGCGAHRIAVMPIPHHGLGEAINDRLRRAAAPRP
ncbi:translation factor SUA5 [Rhodopseudomonas thermotolerans]|uniref:Threonylcarbamoyl-AMP synthase n=3 Tax=Nitrobacteraceae TaxID=41294 RepID=A0A336JL65_9BRAD|nr:translation factor SUA5 [Rhodopseudomonas pentothenatexigens]REG03945.1 translation factor SUA5 [Rhodopseudomonas thermotolerans]SSW90425.1 translation factor SUA5 [Rhodopseudomonas pentothenatexigens]